MKIFKRRSGLTLTDIGLIVLAAYGGYKGWQEYKSPYKLKQENGIYCLLEKETNRKEKIREDFQLGSIDYRVKGLLKESKQKFRESLDNLAKEYDLN